VTGSDGDKTGVIRDIVAGKGEWAEEKDASMVATKLAVWALQQEEESSVGVSGPRALQAVF
jgi:hypothetical protein